MNLLRWLSGSRDLVPGMSPDELMWTCVTISLSALIVIGYCIIAIGWYFQSKLARAESTATLSRLLRICVTCGVFGTLFQLMQMPWAVWRIYDAALLLVCLRTWRHVLNTRGLSLVDERLAQLEELEESATKYREIAELLPHMVWTATDDGIIDFSNQRWRDYAGDDRTWLQAVHPEERMATLTAWNQSLATRKSMTLEARLGGRSEFRTFVIKATPIMHGDAFKWLGACADVEDQKLLAAEKELQAKQKSFFLNALSHDLRAPLHNVVLNAHLLKMLPRHNGGTVAGEDPDMAESVEMIMENAIAAGDLVSKLLDFARVGAHENNATEAVPVGATVQQLVRRFAPIAEQKGLYVRADVGNVGDASANITILSDRQKIERILSNLVDNAIKYTSRGGVTISVAAAADPGNVSIFVTDTGVGVPPQSVPFLFDEFYQVNNHERDRSKGFGMGLAICKCLAHHIGGDVRLASSSPDGSCFELLLKGVGAGVGVDRGGRQGGAESDRRDPEASRLCGV